jgi:uncharacterized protein
MSIAFADTGYWIALLDSRDNLHDRAKSLRQNLGITRIVTSEMVFAETLNAFSGRRKELKQSVVSLIECANGIQSLEVLPQTPELFQQALQLYGQRLDQAWSHTDCASFVIMQQRGIVEALAYDKHFEQAGFRALMRLA